MMGDPVWGFLPVFGQSLCRASPSTFSTLKPHLLQQRNLSPSSAMHHCCIPPPSMFHCRFKYISKMKNVIYQQGHDLVKISDTKIIKIY